MSGTNTNKEQLQYNGKEQEGNNSFWPAPTFWTMPKILWNNATRTTHVKVLTNAKNFVDPRFTRQNCGPCHFFIFLPAPNFDEPMPPTPPTPKFYLRHPQTHALKLLMPTILYSRLVSIWITLSREARTKYPLLKIIICW